MVLRTRSGQKVYNDLGNAYDQEFELEDGRWISVVTIRVDDGAQSEYLDVTPEVAEKIRDDLETAVPIAKRTQMLLDRHVLPPRRREVRVRPHTKRSK